MKLQKNTLYLVLFGFLFVSSITGLVLTQNDPVEQARKIQDEKLQLSAAEFIQATVLYYSVHAGLPWFAEDENGVNCFGDSKEIATVPMDSLQPCLQTLISESALRKDFVAETTMDSLFVTNPNPQTGDKLDTIVCFQPQSKEWQTNKHTKFSVNGELAAENRCHANGGTEFCYWCTQ